MTNNTRPLILVGARSNFGDIISIAGKLGITIHGILDKYFYGNTAEFSGIPVIGNEDWLLDRDNQLAQTWKQDYDFFVSSWWTGSQHLNDIGLNNEQVRIDRINLVEQAEVNVISLISPEVQMLPGTNLKFGKGIMVMSFVGLNDNITIGDYSIVEWAAALSHATHLGRNVLVGVRALLSSVTVEDNVRIGPGANIIGGMTNEKSSLIIGSGSTVWTGASVFKDIPPDSMVTAPMGKVLSKQRTLND